MILLREFYERDTLTVASDLVGHVLVRRTEEGTVSGIIVETEAYLGAVDDAAHSYKGKSDRVRVQYGPAGCAYIYMIYGMHFCLNITTGPPGVPEVVLIRALEPLSGVDLMRKRRGTDKLLNLCSGPGKLCRALDIGAALYGTDLCAAGALFVETGGNPEAVISSKRIGIDYAVKTRDMMWRFTAAGNKFLSRPPE
jgi:DNA-3-methyladenine glycosylase